MKKVFTNAKKNARSETHNTVYQIALNSAVAVTHANNSKKICQAAFTLAEVLITLGVIGIVAAMTMPSLIANYQKKVWVNQLKKSVSVLEQGFQKMLADDGVDDLADTNVWSYLDTTVVSPTAGVAGECYLYYDYNSVPSCTLFFNQWKKYFNIIDISQTPYDYTHNYLNSNYGEDMSSNYFFKFADGLWLSGQIFSPKGTDIRATLWIDVNGEKRPNMFGRDVFTFGLDRTGKFILYGDSNNCKTGDVDGSNCLKRIVENGWVMDY